MTGELKSGTEEPARENSESPGEGHDSKEGAATTLSERPSASGKTPSGGPEDDRTPVLCFMTCS
jgi:hypothetical protein